MTKKFEARTADFIARKGLLHKEAPVVVALSGGADSVALLAVLTRLGYDCRAAHCNFHLRGDESMRDMRHAGAVAEKLGVDIYIRDFDVPARMRETGESVEMACRSLRYKWFSDLLDRDGAQAIAVGHHREDRVETFMLNLMRGTGIAGLTSMRPRSGHVVRPLLMSSRGEIEEYIASLGLGYVDDSSNSSDLHRRNRLRNSILPLMEDKFPGAMNAILRTIGNLEEAEAIYREAVDRGVRKYMSRDGIDMKSLRGDEHAGILLFEHLKTYCFTYTQICDMLSGAESSGLRFFSTDGATVAELDRGMLSLREASGCEPCDSDVYLVALQHDIVSPVHIIVTQADVSTFRPEGLGADVAYFDASMLDDDAYLELRHARRGDRLVPFGSSKSKLVSDLFANAKYSAEQKRRAWLLTCNGEIVWIPGLRNTAAFPVGPGTKRFLRLQLKK